MRKLALNIFDRFARFAVGADENILALCPEHEQRRILNKAALVIIPSILALVSGHFAAEVFTQNPWEIHTTALIWAVLIFMLDRAIVIQTRDGQWSLSMVLRMAMAVVLSLLVTEPIVQQIFHDPILQRENLKESQIDQAISAETRSKEAEFQSKLAPREAEAAQLRHEVLGELDGTSGTKQIGKGEIFLEKSNRLQKLELETAQLKEEIDAQRSAFARQMETKRVQEISALAKGLAGRLATLHEIMDGNWIIAWAVWLLRILFFLIEIMPLTLKMRSHDEEDDPDLYGEIQLMRSQEHLGAIRQLAETRKQNDKKRATNALLADKHHLESKILSTLSDDKRIQIAMILERQRAMEHLREEDQLKFETVQDDPLKQKAHEQQMERMSEHYQRSLYNQYMRFASEGMFE